MTELSSRTDYFSGHTVRSMLSYKPDFVSVNIALDATNDLRLIDVGGYEVGEVALENAQERGPRLVDVTKEAMIA